MPIADWPPLAHSRHFALPDRGVVVVVSPVAGVLADRVGFEAGLVLASVVFGGAAVVVSTASGLGRSDQTCTTEG